MKGLRVMFVLAVFLAFAGNASAQVLKWAAFDKTTNYPVPGPDKGLISVKGTVDLTVAKGAMQINIVTFLEGGQGQGPAMLVVDGTGSFQGTVATVGGNPGDTYQVIAWVTAGAKTWYMSGKSASGK